MAAVAPFRAVRYAGAAGSPTDLVAPPYDAVTREERERLFERSPYNVVRLILPESPEAAGRLYRDWLSSGILEREPDPAAWLLVESYVGPDGVERERRGVITSLAVEPYAAGRVLPHERTHRRIREERLRLLRATGVQPEPIFLLHEGHVAPQQPECEPDVEANGSRLWRLGELDLAPLAEVGLLIADGHHRYESALELGGEPRIMALLVSTEDPGLQVFPTHRTFSGRPDLREPTGGETVSSVEEALELLDAEPRTGSAAVAYRDDGIELLRGEEGEPDVELVDRFGHEGIGYTPRPEAAVGAVDRGEADAAFLVRPPRV
jgi:Protein of unknown function (DUF1015)